ncbi:MAG: PAS domain-containing protein, partial [Planctomycetes bacterium]|nr:PAS domain-containing protein [Planctomycetota bacterium]
MSDDFRWQGFFQNAAQPVFLLNRQRRILFVNRAWEACTGLLLAEVKGRACRRRGASSPMEADDAILAACAAPADAIAGRPCRVRRRVPQSANWWEIQFLPLLGPSGLIGILGSIHVLAAPSETPP